MEQTINNEQSHEDTKKLALVVSLLSFSVAVIFGLIPLA